MSDENSQELNQSSESSESQTDQESGHSNTESESAHEDSIEEKAKKMGHVPKDQFKGDPDKWVDAQTFVERGENSIPIMRSQIKRQQAQLEALNQTIKEFSDYHTKTEQRAYEKAFKELKAQQLQAVANADHQSFLEIDQQIAELNAEAREKIPPKVKEAQKEQDASPEFANWSASNSWYGKNSEMSDYADQIGTYLKKNKNFDSETDFLNAVTEKVKKEFPEKFTNPKRNSANSVESSTNAAGSKKGEKTFSDLPQNAKDTFARWQRDGIKITKEQYVKQYFEEE